MPQIITRPYYETTAPELQREYAKYDAQVMAAFKDVTSRLRSLSKECMGPDFATDRHPDFDLTRYDALKRTAMQLASDLERAVNNSGFAR